MTIEQKLEILRKAMEMGAYVEVTFHDGPEQYSDLTKPQAEQIISEMSELAETPYKNDFHGNAQWFSVKQERFKVTAFYKPVYLEEDVNLDGMKEVI